MAQTIKLKRSATPGAIPSLESLELGEIAINTNDGKLYIKKDDGTSPDTIVEVSGTGGLASGNLNFLDNEKALFGTGSDLQIYHDGNHSYIKDAGTGQLRLLAGTNVQIWNSDATSLAANFNGDTQTSLYYAGSAKLTTTATGIDVTGTVTMESLGIGTTSPPSTLTVLGPNDVTGGVTLTSTETDASNKIGRIKNAHYTNAEEPFTFVLTRSELSDNVINLGGSSSVENAATRIGFWTSANNTTLTGTEVMRINSAQNVGIGETSAMFAGYKLQVRDDNNGDSNPLLISNKDFSVGTTQSVAINFGLSRDSGTHKPQAGRIRVGREGNTWDAADANIDSYMDFSVYQSNALSTKLTIASDGLATFAGDVTVSGDLLLNTTNSPTTTHAIISSDYSAAGTTNTGLTITGRSGGNWHNNGIHALGTALTFSTGTTGTTGADAANERMRIDSRGVVGINAVPKAWDAAFSSVLQVGAMSVLTSGGDNGRIFSNAYYDGGSTYKRINAGYAQNYEQGAGEHSWHNAASADADSTFTWSESMRIDASGNVGIGTSLPTQALDVRTQAVVGNGTDGVKLTYSTGNSSGIIDTGFSSTALEFRTGNSFAALIDSSGNVGIGTTTPYTPAHFKATGNGSAPTDVLTIETYRDDVGNAFTGGSIVFVNSDTNSAGQARIKVGSTNDPTPATNPIGLNGEQHQSFIFETGESASSVISNIDGNATTITVTHLAVSLVAGQRIAINAGAYTGSYTIDTVLSNTQFTIADTAHDLAADTTSRTLLFANPRDSMIIRADGNVGIGTTTPEKNLSIGNSQAEGIQFNFGTTNDYRNQILNYWNTSADSRMDFNIARTSGAVPSTIMSVGYNSNVGIGTTTPASTLDLTSGTDTAERAIKIQNDTVILYTGVEGSTGNRFVGSAVGNAFFGTTSAHGLELATNNNVRMTIDSAGNATFTSTLSSGALTVTGEITATGNITAYFSDERFKTKTRNIENPLEKVQALSGFMFVENELARSLGYKNDKEQVALSAQEVQAVLPEAVSLAPIDMKTNQETGEITSKSGEDYLTVDYAKLVPLLVEAIKELKDEVDELKKRIK
jgi:hypothetical protein